MLLGTPARNICKKCNKCKKENLHCSCQKENHQKTDSAHSDLVAVTVEEKKTASDIPVVVEVTTKVFMTCKVNLTKLNPNHPQKTYNVQT